MKKMLFAAAVLTALATPALAQSMAPTTGTRSYTSSTADTSAYGAFAQAPAATRSRAHTHVDAPAHQVTPRR